MVPAGLDRADYHKSDLHPILSECVSGIPVKAENAPITMSLS